MDDPAEPESIEFPLDESLLPMDDLDRFDADPNGVDPGMEDDESASGKRIALVGRFGGMNQREAANVLRSFDAVVVDIESESLDWIVIGADESPLAEADLLAREFRDAAAAGELEILHETELWQRLGLVELEQASRQAYTPAMLAHLLGVSVRVIRRWQRRGLIRPVRTLHRLPYFDFQEVITARRLARWIASGASPQAIERRLAEWVEVLPEMQRPLDQLSVLIEGKQVLLRHGEGLLEPGGQLRFDFGAMESDDPSASPSVLSMADESARMGWWDGDREPSVGGWDEAEWAGPQNASGFRAQRRGTGGETDSLLIAAYAAEDDGDFETAIDCCHAIIARDGPRADISFQIGELLYRTDQCVAARERYYMAIELDPDFVEARASLGNVLAETGQSELAVAAFRGALAFHDDYADVHYNLARLLDELDRPIEARHHWNRFLQLAPESPWASEAIDRIRSET